MHNNATKNFGKLQKNDTLGEGAGRKRDYARKKAKREEKEEIFRKQNASGSNMSRQKFGKRENKKNQGETRRDEK